MSNALTRKLSPSKIGLAVAAPLAAAVFSILISSLSVIASKKSPIEAFRTMWDYGTEAGSLMEIVNTATPYYIAAIAIAVTFRAGLFNIGVEGQLRLGALFSCYIGAMFVLPPVLHVAAVFIVAMTFGGLWAAIAAYLKVKRGVNEVISTIMLNALAGGLSAYLLSKHFAVVEEGSNNLATKELPASAQVPDLMPLLRKVGIEDQPGGGVYGMFFVAVALGLVFWFVVNRTRFGFELRASGLNPIAARVSGVNSKKMTFLALVISGAFSALLFGFLEVSSRALELIDIAPETYVIMQGSILLSAVIAYEVVRRFKLTLQSKELAKVVTA